MKKIKSLILIALAFVLCFGMCACGGGSSSDDEKITSESQAISAVKNYGLGLDQRIATSLGYKEFHDPDYGTTSATKNEDGSWSVTIKGSMFGYVDEYHSQLENYKFDVSATVTEDGEVTVRVSKVN